MSTTEALGEALIPVVNQLQDIFGQITIDLKIELPQVAVIGSQSSGKSSVLEALVGRDFLPRGPDICTRRPLVLQLVRLQESEQEFGEFLHARGEKFTDFEAIRREIEAETDREAGGGKGISDRPIRLKISSPHVLTMTLVDLPGITRVPVGDQPTNIESRIRQMIIAYIQHPTCIILAVSAANSDLTNSDAVSMARAVDPEGFRTIGVMTKLDIMDKGTNAVALLKNEVVPLRLGYIGIVNRSQFDINNKTAMKTARRNENEFFTQNTEYYEVLDNCGISNLALNLNKILVTHIQSLLPGLRRKIMAETDLRKKELLVYGDEPPADTPIEQGALLLNLLTQYSQRFAAMLDGKSDTLVPDLSGGAKIRDIFQTEFSHTLKRGEDDPELSDEIIAATIRNSTGVSGSLLIPQEPFELLVRRSIKTLLDPSLKCKNSVEEELFRIANECVPEGLSRFASLQRRMVDVTSEFIRSGGVPSEMMIKSLVDCENAYINYDHEAFIGGRNALAEVMSEQEHRNTSTPVNVDGSAEVHNGQDPLPGQLQQALKNLRHPALDAVRQLQAEPGLKMLKSESRAEKGDGGSVSSEGNQNPGNFITSLLNRFGDQQKAEKRQEVPSSPEPSKTESAILRPVSHTSLNRSSAPLSDPRRPTECVSVTDGDFSALHSDIRIQQMHVPVAVTRKLVNNYMSIVRSNVGDMVPKTVMHFLVNRSKTGLQQHLISALYKEEKFSELMSEKPEIAKKRKKCRTALKALNDAMAALDSLPQDLADRGASKTVSLSSFKESSSYASQLYSSPRRVEKTTPFEFD